VCYYANAVAAAKTFYAQLLLQIAAFTIFMQMKTSVDYDYVAQRPRQRDLANHNKTVATLPSLMSARKHSTR